MQWISEGVSMVFGRVCNNLPEGHAMDSGRALIPLIKGIQRTCGRLLMVLQKPLKGVLCSLLASSSGVICNFF
jgi:hypothetical protein